MDSSPHPFWVTFSNWIQCQIRDWVKPTTIVLALGAISDLSRSKADLLVENAILRQQLIVLHRQVKRPKLKNGDRIRLVLLARCSRFWHQALHIIQLSNRIHSCIGIEICSAGIGGIFPIEETKSREYPLK